MLIGPEQISAEFNSLLNSFQGIRIAGAKDARRLADFVNTTAMSAGQLKVGFQRGTDYFSLLRLQGEKYCVMVCEEEEQIVAVGAVSFRNAGVRGTSRCVGYLQDLRVSASAKHRSRVHFYKCFSEFVRLCPSLAEFDCCSIFLTAILDDNRAALAALSRPAFALEYTRLASYTAYTWPKIPAHLLKLGKAASMAGCDNGELVEFYKQRRPLFAYDLSQPDIERLLDHAYPVVIRCDGAIQAACLLVQTSEERCLNLGYEGIGYQWKCAGLYISALRVAEQSSLTEELMLRNKLIRKALGVSAFLPGAFVGLVNVNDPSTRLSVGLNATSVHVRGSLYRVYHPEHAQLKDFSHGFLRPSHIAALEWVFM